MSAYDVRPFPPPPAAVREAIEQLHLASIHPSSDEFTLRRLAELPRPWDPGSCPRDLLAELWPWIADVVDWLNSQWMPDDARVPMCWPDHADLCQWLAALAAARYTASFGVAADTVHIWAASWFPELHRRIGLLRTCRMGRHE
ncbi:hypothetical protein [Nocardioides bruguierae]|uniref:DUF4913 domain-containing protein n=1 Tax=Nocardioides bruguierae TaxID=2945102 RepID=A0A9X2D9P4_9ACTN|nr:hypothetical protein [Nocardioides bruguierae]MCM0621928.1 hypothetical protein [Nocardioides bruguierae]